MSAYRDDEVDNDVSQEAAKIKNELDVLDKKEDEIKEIIKENKNLAKALNSVDNKILQSYLYVLLFVLLCISAVLIMFLAIEISPSNITSVTIEFNIAELLAALLGGGGIAIAGFAYFKKGSQKEENEKNSTG